MFYLTPTTLRAKGLRSRTHGAGAFVDSAWEQKKLEARKMIAEGAAESPASSVRLVGQPEK
jgi:hypothetical protein